MEGKVFSIEKSHGNRNKRVNSEMVEENPVNSIINDGKSLKEVYRVYKKTATSEFYRVYKKNRNLGISQEIDIVLKTKKILGAWEFKIAQLSKLLHTRVHKAKFMHLFNAQQQ